MARYGIYGGTFDPVHAAHIQMALLTRQQLHLDKVFFVPTRPWQKTAKASDQDRLNMLKIAIADYSDTLTVDTRELDRAGASYSIDTLFSFRQEFPKDDLFFLLGGDQWQNLKTWVLWERFPELVNLAVFPRGETHFESLYAGKPVKTVSEFLADPHKSGDLIELSGSFFPISSTAIRNNINHLSEDLLSGMAPGVFSYIREHKLYGFGANEE